MPGAVRWTLEHPSAGAHRDWPAAEGSEVEQEVQHARDLKHDFVIDGAEASEQSLLGDGLELLALGIAQVVEPRAVGIDLNMRW